MGAGVCRARGRGAGGYWLYQGRQHARQDAAAATQRAEAAETAQKELAQKVEKLETEKTELASAKEELAKDVQAKAGECRRRPASWPQLKGTYDNLQEKMKDEIAKGDIRLSQSGGRLRVDLVDKILFDSGEAVISKRGEGVLGRVGARAGDDGRQADPGVGSHRQQPDLGEAGAAVPDQLGAVGGARGQRRALPGGEGGRAGRRT